MTAPELTTDPVIPPPTPPAVRRRRIPGLRLLSMTVGVQRATLVIGLALVALFVFLAVFAPLLAPYDFYQNSANGVDFARSAPPSAEHWFGTSIRGEDVFSRVIFGARTALLVIVISLVLSLIIGVPLGLVSGYIGRWVDRVLVLVMDAIYAFPTLLLAIVVSIVVAGGRSSSLGGMISAAVAITAIYVPQYFRVVRNATVAVKNEPYVDAARVTGASTWRIMFRHILANVTQSLPVIVTINGGDAILTLAGLGFLGFGIEPTQAAEWGFDLNKSLQEVSNGVWWTSVFPGTAIVLVVLGLTLVGESLNEVLNPLLRTRRALGPATVADDTATLTVGASGTPVIIENPDAAADLTADELEALRLQTTLAEAPQEGRDPDRPDLEKRGAADTSGSREGGAQ